MFRAILVVLLAALLPVGGALAKTKKPVDPLKGSKASVARSFNYAVGQKYTFLKDKGHVQKFVEQGHIKKVRETEHLGIKYDVKHPYGRPDLLLFLERLSQQYQGACGEKLLVTDLIRPHSEERSNSSKRSVHPTGIAVDFRVPRDSSCHKWLKENLITLEKRGVLEATRERFPAHYHVVLFTDKYHKYVRGKEVARKTK